MVTRELEGENIMSFFDSNSLYNDNEENFIEIEENAISTDIPTGWSSICLDDTVTYTYYIECNASLAKSKIERD